MIRGGRAVHKFMNLFINKDWLFRKSCSKTTDKLLLYLLQFFRTSFKWFWPNHLTLLFVSKLRLMTKFLPLGQKKSENWALLQKRPLRLNSSGGQVHYYCSIMVGLFENGFGVNNKLLVFSQGWMMTSQFQSNLIFGSLFPKTLHFLEFVSVQ